MPFTLPELPYAKDALVPNMSVETLEFHHGKHHNAYVVKLNELTAGKPEADKSLEDLVKTAEGAVFNQAAQIWNHTFFWHSLSPKGGGEPTGAALEAINKSFGSFEQFKKDFTAAAVGVFGSGWAWVVKDGEKLKIVTTSNAGCPVRDGHAPVLTCDVWEHAYYIDHRNSRPNFLASFWNLVNWDFFTKNLG